MVAEPTEWESRLLRDASIRPAPPQRAPRRLAAVALACVATVALVCLAVVHIHDRRALADRDRAVIRAADANADLQDFIARLQNELGARTHDLAATRQRLAAAAATGSQLSQQQDQAQQQLAVAQAAAASKTHNIVTLAQTLDKAQHELHLEAAQRATLTARLDRAAADQAQGADRQAQAQAGLADAQRRLQLLTAEQSRTAAERDHLRARVGELEQQIASASHATPKPVAAAKPAALPARVAAATPPRVAAAAPPRVAPAITVAPAIAAAAPGATVKPAVFHPAAAVAATVAPKPAADAAPHPAAVATAAPVAEARGPVGRIERLLASTGVDVSRLFAKYGVERAEGGPFMPLRDRPPVEKLSAEKLAVLRMAKSLPLAAPLDDYRLMSPFGARHDPINGHESFHTGVDLAAPYESPVYATAAGTVTFAGFRNDYGRIVEIDHGNGISTRYAHLHRLLVSAGEQVAAHAEIGLLGTSGRSTGPHVHYEVLVNGEPQNPERFIEMSRVVSVAAR